MAGSDLVGNGLDASQGAGSIGPGQVDNLGRPYETGNPFGFSAADLYDGLGNGSNNLGNAVPYGDVNPLAFAGGSNVGGGQPGSFGGFLPPLQTGAGGYDFTGLNTGEGASNGAFPSLGGAGNPFGYNTPASGPGDAFGAGSGTLGQLPAGFSTDAYRAANPDVAAAGMDPAAHYLNFGRQEGRALAPDGWAQTLGPPAGTTTFGPTGTPTIGSGSTTSTIGPPAASNALPAFFSPRDYVAANADLAGMSDAQAIDHFQTFGRNEVRSLAPWLEASVYGAPAGTSTQGPGGLSPTFQPPQPTQAFGPSGSIDVMSSGLVPTQQPPDLTSTFGPGPTITARTGTFNPDEYLKANADVAASGQSALDHFRNYGAREGRAIDTLGNHFNGDAYLAQNRDVALAGLNPLEHFLRYGAQEARTLAPSDWASPLTATTNAGTYGAPAATQTLGPGGMTSTYGAPDPTLTIGPPALTGTYGPPATTPTFGAGGTVPMIGPGFTQPSYSPGGGIGNPFGFSGANVGSGLGATSQSFSSFYPLDTNIGISSGGSPGGGGISDFGFSGADVGGFDVNAASPPMEGGGGGGGGGTAKGSSSSAAFLADQARTRAYWESLAKPADLYSNTNTHTTPVITPVVPNLTVKNLGNAMPGAMFSMFAPWR